MKTYNIKIGTRNGMFDTTINIPNEIFFFYHTGECGHILVKDCEHYTTIVDSEKYKNWIDSLKKSEIRINRFGVWTILTIENIHNSTPIPTIDRQTWFSIHNIDFSKYVILNKDKNYNYMNCYRVINFENIFDIKCACVTLRDFFSSGPLYEIKICNGMNYRQIIDNDNYDCVRTKSRFFEGDDAEELWNSMLVKTLNQVFYNAEKVNENYDFDKEHNEAVERFKTWSIESLSELIKTNN